MFIRLIFIMKRILIAFLMISVTSTSFVFRTKERVQPVYSFNQTTDSAALVSYLQGLAGKEKHPLLKRHFESLLLMTQDKTHGFSFTEKNNKDAARVLQFLKGDGHLWQTYLVNPRPLIMAFTSATDNKNSYYWLFLPKDFDQAKTKYPLFVELHGSGGGSNNNPREMLYQPLQPEIAGVTTQGYRKEGIFILPWGRGDKGYRDIAEKDIWECISDVDKNFKTDPQRQYLYGFSMGGGGTYKLAQQSAGRWAAIGMYSAAFRDSTFEDVLRLKNMPVWMTWGEEEKQLTLRNRSLKDAFLKQGNELWWTEVKGVGHNYMGQYQDSLMNWFTRHKKN